MRSLDNKAVSIVRRNKKMFLEHGPAVLALPPCCPDRLLDAEITQQRSAKGCPSQGTGNVTRRRMPNITKVAGDSHKVATLISSRWPPVVWRSLVRRGVSLPSKGGEPVRARPLPCDGTAAFALLLPLHADAWRSRPRRSACRYPWNRRGSNGRRCRDGGATDGGDRPACRFRPGERKPSRSRLWRQRNRVAEGLTARRALDPVAGRSDMNRQRPAPIRRA